MAKGDTGKERKYYQITKKGKTQLQDEKKKWEVFSGSINKIIGGELNAFA
jgi:DNA-binding PadR family transcriptional regulator